MVGIFAIFSGYMNKSHHHLRLVDDREREEEEFKPIDHPSEPTEDDRPMKHPLPFSSLVNEEGESTETFIESLRKMAVSPRENGGTSKLVDRKDYNYNFLQVFQQCKDFEA